VHRVVYECPISGETHRFVTNLTNVTPGLIAYLYKTRWDIEKIFDTMKNKLAEKRAWATSVTAKNMQAQFVCIAHNLLLLFEQWIRKEGVENEAENNRRYNRLEKALISSGAPKHNLPVFLTTPRRQTQLSVKFIRWLRNHLYTNTSWMEAMSALKRIYAVF
jgi:Transposase DDE domain